MRTIQIIEHHGRPVAIAVNGQAIVAQHVAVRELAHVQAKALYALLVEAGEAPGPYTNAGAEKYARDVAAAQQPRPRQPRSTRRDRACR